MSLSRFLLQNISMGRHHINKNWSPTFALIIKRDVHAVRSEQNLEDINVCRKEVAPWIPIGHFQKGLLSHLSTSDIFRALFVLRMCSYNFIVERSVDLFTLSQKFGFFGEYLLRKTFFNQFVGGDKEVRMGHVVNALQTRGLRLMVAPVLEEDVEDERSAKKVYDDNTNSLLDISQMTSSLEKKRPIWQLKPSAIMPALALERVSEAITAQCKDKKQIAHLVEELANSVDNQSQPSLKLDSKDRNDFMDGLRRADLLIKKAQEKSLHVLVDAEFYSCKPAISIIALVLMARYNGRGHIVGNTIQGYLKDATDTIRDELDIITNLIGCNWYGKVVRGAYMDRERYLAAKLNKPSPICDSYEDTNVSYNKVIAYILQYLARGSGKGSPHLVVATHNERSIRLAAQYMKDLNISCDSNAVAFAQIYGMADYLSTPLLEQGYEVYKSTPYGPIGKVMPYLARRASENRSVMNGAREERDMLTKELKNRLFS